MLIPQTVLIGLVVALVGYALQQRAWRHKLIEEIRQREFDECLKLIDELAAQIDSRLYHLDWYIRVLKSDPTNEEHRKEYRESVKSWMSKFSSNKAKLYHYFGRLVMLDFENEVHSSMREVSDILVRTQRYGMDGLSRAHLAEFHSIDARLSLARYVAFKYIRELNERLANGDVGRTRMFNNIEVGHLELISATYLLQRLFGVKSRFSKAYL